MLLKENNHVLITYYYKVHYRGYSIEINKNTMPSKLGVKYKSWGQKNDWTSEAEDTLEMISVVTAVFPANSEENSNSFT